MAKQIKEAKTMVGTTIRYDLTIWGGMTILQDDHTIKVDFFTGNSRVTLPTENVIVTNDGYSVFLACIVDTTTLKAGRLQCDLTIEYIDIHRVVMVQKNRIDADVILYSE